jgi:hypothetical protein
MQDVEAPQPFHIAVVEKTYTHIKAKIFFHYFSMHYSIGTVIAYILSQQRFAVHNDITTEL